MLKNQHDVGQEQQYVDRARKHIGSIAAKGESTHEEGENQQERVRVVQTENDALTGE